MMGLSPITITLAQIALTFYGNVGSDKEDGKMDGNSSFLSAGIIVNFHPIFIIKLFYSTRKGRFESIAN